jgi:chromosome segregation ATPase
MNNHAQTKFNLTGMSSNCPMEWQRVTARNAINEIQQLRQRNDTQCASIEDLHDQRRVWTNANLDLATQVTSRNLRVFDLNNEIAESKEDTRVMADQRDVARAEIERIEQVNDRACAEICGLADRLDIVTAERDAAVAQAVDALSRSISPPVFLNTDEYCDKLMSERNTAQQEVARLLAVTKDDTHTIELARTRIEYLQGQLRQAVEAIDHQSDNVATIKRLREANEHYGKMDRGAIERAKLDNDAMHAELERVRKVATARYHRIDALLLDLEVARKLATDYAATLDEAREDAKAIVENVNEYLPDADGDCDFCG